MRRIGPIAMGASFVAVATVLAHAQPQSPERVSGCTPTAGVGKDAPTLETQVPKRGTSGYALALRVTVSHGRGEHVLPAGLKLDPASDAARELEQAGFELADPDGPAGAVLGEPKPVDEAHATTELVLRLVPLNDAPGTHTRVLPALPIAVARASGRVVTLCTESAAIDIEDPTSSTPDALPHRGPEPRPQREEWTSLKHALLWGAAAIALGALGAWLWLWHQRRPKPVAPPPPPRPPWELALEALASIRTENLVAQGRLPEHVDRVSDTLRAYLGSRFGFDGLESTTDEVRTSLDRVSALHLSDDVRQAALAFLSRADLIKFARAAATADEASALLDEGERLVRITMPADPTTVTAQRSGGSS